MNVKFLNPFIEAAFEVLRVETHQEITRGELGLQNGPYRTDDLTVILSLVGSVDGMVFYSMGQETAIKLASMILGEENTELNSLVQSGIAELGNVITGKASVKLAEAGYEATISPPALILGKGATLSTLDCPRLVLPLNTTAGSVTIHLALRQGSMPGLKTPEIPIGKAFARASNT
jgi:chemotaxis protein CheX